MTFIIIALLQYKHYTLCKDIKWEKSANPSAVLFPTMSLFIPFNVFLWQFYPLLYPLWQINHCNVFSSIHISNYHFTSNKFCFVGRYQLSCISNISNFPQRKVFFKIYSTFHPSNDQIQSKAVVYRWCFTSFPNS